MFIVDDLDCEAVGQLPGDLPALGVFYGAAVDQRLDRGRRLLDRGPHFVQERYHLFLRLQDCPKPVQADRVRPYLIVVVESGCGIPHEGDDSLFCTRVYRIVVNFRSQPGPGA